MKLIESCPQCLKDLAKSKEFTPLDLGNGKEPMNSIRIPLDCFVEFTVSDENVYNITCTKGHSSVYIHPDQKFELLFKSGLHAIYDGYYREAVGSLAASLERLYEFATKVICVSSGIEIEELTKTWNLVSKQSERQLGGFLLLYLLIFNKTAQTLSNSKVNFRNSVIHSGNFPSKEAVLDYANETLSIIYAILKELKEKFSDNLRVIYFKEFKSAVDNYKNKNDVSYLMGSSQSFVLTILEDKPDWTVEKMLEDIESDRDSIDPNNYDIKHEAVGEKRITEITVFNGDLFEPK